MVTKVKMFNYWIMEKTGVFGENIISSRPNIMILGKTVEGAPAGCDDMVEWLYWLQAFAFFIQLQHYYAFTS